MKKYDINVLKDAADRILFDMSDDQYQTLLNEFDIITKQMGLIGKGIDLDSYEPMVFPFDVVTSYLRDDVSEAVLSKEEALKNAKNKMNGQIKLPKVVI